MAPDLYAIVRESGDLPPREHHPVTEAMTTGCPVGHDEEGPRDSQFAEHWRGVRCNTQKAIVEGNCETLRVTTVDQHGPQRHELVTGF
jgi:hypothetical protein